MSQSNAFEAFTEHLLGRRLLRQHSAAGISATHSCAALSTIVAAERLQLNERPLE
jgi:hypothetical protein